MNKLKEIKHSQENGKVIKDIFHWPNKIRKPHFRKYTWRNINDFGLINGHVGWIRPISDIILHFYLFNKTHYRLWERNEQPYPKCYFNQNLIKNMSVDRLLNFLEMEIYISKGSGSSIDFRTAKFKIPFFDHGIGTGRSNLLHKRHKQMKSSLIPFNEDLLMIIVEKFLEEDEKGALFKYINFALFPQSKSNTGFMREPEPDFLSGTKMVFTPKRIEEMRKKKGDILLQLLLDIRTFKKKLKTALNIFFTKAEEFYETEISYEDFIHILEKIVKETNCQDEIWKFFTSKNIAKSKYLHLFLRTPKNKEFIYCLLDKINFDNFAVDDIEQIILLKGYLNNSKNISNDDLLHLAQNNNEEISKHALGHIEKRQLDARFHILLMQTKLPACVEVGKDFFHNQNPSNDNYFNNLIELCDSTVQEVQEFGLQLIKENMSYLPKSELFKKLSENNNLLIKEFLIQEINSNLVNRKDFLNFEIDSLKTRNRNRTLKNFIKDRLEKLIKENLSPKIDKQYIDSLISLSLGLVETDQEWAIKNLTNLRLNKHKISELKLTTPILK